MAMKQLLIYILCLIMVLVFINWMFFTKVKTETYTGCWIEKDEAGNEGNCRHNGIKTDSGYLFTDTIFNKQLNKIVVHTTLISITEN